MPSFFYSIFGSEMEKDVGDTLMSQIEIRSRHERLLAHLGADTNTAWQKYAQLLRRLDRFFEFKRFSEPDRLTIETLRRVEAKLDSEQIDNIDGYAVGVAKNVARE